jgi:5-methylcytosine-specific restriction enzyme B
LLEVICTHHTSTSQEHTFHVQFWILGAYGEGQDPEDRTQTFISSQAWINGYDGSQHISSEQTKRIKVNDLVAIKTTCHDRQTSKNKTLIKAIGKVTKNYNNGKNLDVDWFFTGPSFEIYDMLYHQTVHEVRDPEDIRLIFNQLT